MLGYWEVLIPMIRLYETLFYGMFITVGKMEGTGLDDKYRAFSAVLCLVASHSLFAYSFLVILGPEDVVFGAGLVFLIQGGLGTVFFLAFVRAGRYKTIAARLEKHQKQCVIYSSLVNGALVSTFFLMAAIEIFKASGSSP